MSHMLHATDLVAMLPPELAANYNGTAVQRERVLHCLRRAGAAGVLGPDLARMCNVPCITKRISELRRDGVEIDSQAGHVVGPDGTVSACARYVLQSDDDPQGALFSDDLSAGGDRG